MADNVTLAKSSGTFGAASDEVSYSGDTAQVQVMRLVHVTGSEGSKVAQEIVGAVGAGADYAITVQGDASGEAMPISAASLPLPADAATQTTLAAILALLPTALVSGRLDVNIGSGTVAITETAQSTSHLVTAASDNATSVKASAGKLRGIQVFSRATYPIYVKFHNTAGTPTAGSGVVYAVGVQAGTQVNFLLPGNGRSFAAGIGMTVVKDIADNGTTAVAASDALIEVLYE